MSVGTASLDEAMPDIADERYSSTTVAAVDLLALRELLRKIEVVLRSATAAPLVRPRATQVTARFGDVEVNLALRSVVKGGRPVPITPIEFCVLVALLRRSGGVVTREELLREAWEDFGGGPTRRVDMKICRLRRKLETNPAVPRHIVTVPQVGYRLRA